MQGFQILFHGQFTPPCGDEHGHTIPYEGFYTSRIIDSSDADEAVVRVRELIRKELDTTLLLGRQDALAMLEAEECKRVDIDDKTILNRGGFTFY